jgi:hypothetical protein
MKSLRNSPLALAAAALMAAPSAVAQPMSLAPRTDEAARPAQAAALAPAQAPAADAGPADLRGPVGPIPDNLSLTPAPAPQQTAAQPPPPAPPSPPPPAPAPAPQQAAAPPRLAPAPTATVSIGQQDEFTRLAFRFTGATTVTPTLEGNRLSLRFSRAADIDLAELRANLPRFVREVRRVSAAGAPLRLAITLDPGVRHRHFADGDRVVVDILPSAPGSTAIVTENGLTAPAPTAQVNGVARVRVVEEAAVTRITVSWPAPARAAAFRRGEALWLLFDAAGRVDLTGVARVGRRHRDVEVVRGEGVIGLRIPAPPEVLVSAAARDNEWVFTLGGSAESAAAAPLIREIASDGRARMIAQFGREGVVRWINDPEIGDRIGVALVGGPAKGVNTRRATIEAALLPSAHGAVIESRADGVTGAFEGGNLIVTRGGGLIAAAPAQSERAADLEAALLAEAMGDGAPVPDAAAQTGQTLAQVRERIDELTRLAAMEGTDEGAPATARLNLARYLLRNEFAHEAMAALRMAAINQGEMVEIDPDYRLMRAAANVMMGRPQEAMADLNASALRDNPSAALLRGYAAAQRQEWTDARRELDRGQGALEGLPPAWRARMQLALAHAALELNDLAAAEAAANSAMGQAADQNGRFAARLVQARIAAARNDPERALAMLDELAQVRDEEIAVEASVDAIRLRRLGGELPAAQAIEPLEALRYRWRGDATELAIVGMLGDVYSELGRWREAMATMRVAADRFPTNPAARHLRADMSTLFERLFLDGEADQLEPIQALGLFYEFSDITPVGPNGDRIVRLLAGRLVHVDLLEQAAQLLQHQVDERLQGLSRTQVAADLAAIYLMDHKPDRALVVLAGTRQANMPATLLADRRILEARALLELGRLDGAVELVERDRSENAQRVRAEAAWRARDWERAAVEIRALLALRDRASPLDEAGRHAVLRAGVALTLAGNEQGVRTLYRDFAGDMADTESADAFEVVASGVTAEGAAIRDVARAVARTDLMDRFMQHVRTRMTQEAAEAETPAPAPQATATPPTG